MVLWKVSALASMRAAMDDSRGPGRRISHCDLCSSIDLASNVLVGWQVLRHRVN